MYKVDGYMKYRSRGEWRVEKIALKFKTAEDLQRGINELKVKLNSYPSFEMEINYDRGG